MAFMFLTLGIILLIIEGFIPGFGIFGISGLLALGFSLFLFMGADAIAAAIVGGLLFSVVGLCLWAVKFGPDSWLGRMLILHLRSTAQKGYTGTVKRQDLLGKSGVAQTVLRPSGRALIDGQSVDVITDGEFVEPGSTVKVVSVTGGRTVVRQEEV